MPPHLSLFVGVSPALLPNELEEDYSELFNMMANEIVPTTNLEWFAVDTIVDLLWDIARLRLWKNSILVVSRHAALETALLRTHPSTFPNGPYRTKISREEAQQWRTDPEKRDVLEERLEEAGYDMDALNAGAFIEAQVPLATIDRFLCSARGQLNATLKEIGARREFAERAQGPQGARRGGGSSPRAVADRGEAITRANDLHPQDRIQQAQCLPEHRPTDSGGQITFASQCAPAWPSDAN